LHLLVNRAFLPHPDSTEYFEKNQGASEGRFENRITLESLEHYLYFEPTVHIDAISPTPQRIIVAEKDLLAPTTSPLQHTHERTNLSHSSSSKAITSKHTKAKALKLPLPQHANGFFNG
jgi:hypothetical protein